MSQKFREINFFLLPHIGLFYVGNQQFALRVVSFDLPRVSSRLTRKFSSHQTMHEAKKKKMKTFYLKNKLVNSNTSISRISQKNVSISV